eukprot:6178370-Pleurochrysis_carterae.AAC.2
MPSDRKPVGCKSGESGIDLLRSDNSEGVPNDEVECSSPCISSEVMQDRFGLPQNPRYRSRSEESSTSLTPSSLCAHGVVFLESRSE